MPNSDSRHKVAVPSAAHDRLRTIIPGDSELARLMRSQDWSKTPLGPVEQWPQSLRTSVSLILNSQHPMWIGWGPQMVFLYNDAYIDVLSLAKHPWALGRPAIEVWAEIWHVCGPLADKVFQKAEASYQNDVRLFMNRGDFLEETYYSFSYSPITDESGRVGGLFCPSADSSAKVLNARRLRTLSELAANALIEKATESACTSAIATISKNPDDVPFALLYVLSPDRREMQLQSSTVSNEIARTFAPSHALNAASSKDEITATVAKVVESGQPVTISVSHIALPLGPADQQVTHAIVLPVQSRAEAHAIGVLIAGVNPTRKFDDDYRTFYELLSGQVATAIGNARAYEEERRRAEALAELDRAKTAFFSNVSHEFRTPPHPHARSPRRDSFQARARHRSIQPGTCRGRPSQRHPSSQAC
ncbi:MAG TPA: GAF domain-containing protein [Candidatus Koribacter sp.]